MRLIAHVYDIMNESKLALRCWWAMQRYKSAGSSTQPVSPGLSGTLALLRRRRQPPSRSVLAATHRPARLVQLTSREGICCSAS